MPRLRNISRVADFCSPEVPMNQITRARSEQADNRQPEEKHTGRGHVKLGRFEASVEVDISSKGLVAIGVLVSTILLSVVPIISAAIRKRPPRF